MSAIDAAKLEHKVEFPGSSGSYSFERKAWESATSFRARCDWVEQQRLNGMSTDTQEEAAELDRLSAMWCKRARNPPLPCAVACGR